MNPQTTTPTLRIERTMKAPAARIYKAYLDRNAFVKFWTPQDTTIEYDRLEPKVGGVYHYTMRSQSGYDQAFTGRFLELTEFTKIRHSYAFETDMEAMKVPMEIVLTLKETPEGTEVTFEQYGIPAPIPVERAAAEYRKALDRMAEYVETSTT